MMVWRGWGILVVVIAFAMSLLTQLTVDALAGEGTYTGRSSVWAALALLLAAPIIWVLGRRFNRTPPRVLTDQQTGEEVVLRSDHTFFWIKMEYWGVILAVIAGLIALGGMASR